MDHQIHKTLFVNNRLGFHYFPDTLHYGEKEIERWLPLLDELNVKWLALKSPITRAIPESFISAFSSKGINLIVDFDFPQNPHIDLSEGETLISAYGKWGVKYALLDRAPNVRRSWSESSWANPNLVENHMKRFIRFSELTLANGIHPIYPPLIPGGDYWDLAYLKKSIEFLDRVTSDMVKNNFLLSAFAWDWGKHLNWGAGGPDKWQSTKPYKTSKSSQDQIGFRTYEWYMSTVQKILGKIPPVILFESGMETGIGHSPNTQNSPDIEKQRQIYQLIRDKNVYDFKDPQKLIEPIQPQVIANLFYVLTSQDENTLKHRWYSPSGEKLISAQAVFSEQLTSNEKAADTYSFPMSQQKISNFFHKRYILLDEQYKEDLNSFLEQLHPYLDKYRPLIGFSKEEASRAAYIVAISPDGQMTEKDINQLGKNGNLLKIIKPSEINILLKETNYAAF